MNTTIFTSVLPEKNFIWILPFQINTIPNDFPEHLKFFLNTQKIDQISDFYDKKNHYILIPVKENNKKSREELGSLIYKKISSVKDAILLFDFREFDELGLDFLIGFLLFSWSFKKYKTSEKTHPVSEIYVLSHDSELLQEKYRKKKPAIEGVFLARSLTSEPPNVFYPEAYASHLKKLEKDGIQVEILDEEELKKIGMTALLTAGQGSIHSSAVALLTWNGIKEINEKPIVIIGKGVCFDSGGLCLKSTIHQRDMKWDKAGGGVVAGFIQSVAQAKLPCHIIGIIGLIENMPDGGAAKPGDVIKTMSGKTIEIVDTDAEGRLVLADCLWYAQKRFQPKLMIDFGTLTIETFATLGNAYAGLYSNNDALNFSLIQAGKKSGENLWPLPMGEFFAKQIESPIADLKNSGMDLFGENGAAAEFLKCFVNDLPWAHIDISGVSWSKEDLPLSQQGVTGFGVRLLYEWIIDEIKDYSKS